MIFETERLQIVKIRTNKKVSDLYHIYTNPENMKYLGAYEEWTENNLRLRLLQYKHLYQYGLGIYVAKHKATQDIIGEVSFFNSFENTKKPELGYIVDVNYWQQGYGYEIVSGMVNYAQNISCEALIARLDAENKGSARICEKLGFERYADEIMDSGIHRLSYQKLLLE